MLSPLTFEFALEYFISQVHHNQERQKLNGTYLFRVSADVNVLHKSTNTKSKSTEVLLFASKQVGLEVTEGRTKSHHKNS
jgi:hypothetical protein